MHDDPRDTGPLPWTPVDEQPLGEFSIFSLSRAVRRSQTTGRTHAFIRVDAPDWVNVIAVTEAREVVLVAQYRHGTDAVTLEIPGGAIDPGESPLEAARRELEEETGYRASRWEIIGCVEPNPAFMSNRCWTYLAVGCTPDGRMAPDPSEEIELQRTSLAGFTDLIHDGSIRHALVIAAHDHLRRGIVRGAPWAEPLLRAE
jgi:8-oxo-dGTP pyrophosphatase MutT (NUDIX family)